MSDYAFLIPIRKSCYNIIITNKATRAGGGARYFFFFLLSMKPSRKVLRETHRCT